MSGMKVVHVTKVGVQGMARVYDRHGGSVCGHDGGAWDGEGTCQAW